MVQAPSTYDLYNHPGKIAPALNRLAERAILAELVAAAQWNQIKEIPFKLRRSELSLEAPHFVQYVLTQEFQSCNNCSEAAYVLSSVACRDTIHIRTTIDSTLQKKVQNILSTALKNQYENKVVNGAALIVEHSTGQILTWAVASAYPLKSGTKNGFSKLSKPSRISKFSKLSKLSNFSTTEYIDSVRALRQPGSAMKPFLYALALEKGWNAATLIDDSPLKEPVGVGLHTYHNYSNIHYGPVTLRNALGNSLNIPALKTIQFTGVDSYLEKLRKLGITSLNQHPDFYGDGLALGNGEVSLYEMIQAYCVLANSGRFIPLSPFYDKGPVFSYSKQEFQEPVFSKEVASIIGNILSDPGARQLEFGGSDLLDFHV
ncbi:MAG: hypothetical protein HQK67_11725 [Desulfamplus sp.]|nr:hypothetical protein [Desulfamplus sp.]